MLFRQLFDADTASYTYLIADDATKEAMLVDSVLQQVDRDLQLIKELQLTLRYTLETHVHADHITAAAKLKQATGCQIVYPSKAQCQCADLFLNDADTLTIGQITLTAIHTPGHTDCSTSYLVNQDKVLTGDTLLIRGCGRTDFQNGSAEQLYHSITKKLFKLDDKTQVYPAHDYHGLTQSSIGEEKRFNPRLANQSLASFIHIMDNLNLAKPKLIDKAAPANQRCGEC